MTRAWLAALAYRRRTGTWPPSLDALGAAFQGDALRDPFTGLRCRYDPKRGLLWAVGGDGVDDDGDPAQDVVLPLPK